MKATIEGSELVIRIPMEAQPRPSSTGKTLIVATSGGNKETEATIQGKPIRIGVNAFIYRD